MDHLDYERFLDLTYEAAINPDVWPRLLARLTGLTGANSGTMVQQSVETGKGFGIRANIDPAATGLYYGHFATRNVLHQAPDPRAEIRNWTPRVYTDEDKLPKHELVRTEYYNDYLRRFGIHSVLMMRLAVRGMDTVTINMTRPRNRDQFGRDEIELARRLQPHLIRAFDLGQKLAAERGLAADMAESLDRSQHGLFLADAEGRISFANRVGRDLLAEAGGLCTIGGRLSAERAGDARKLDALIAAAASPDPGRRSGGSMALATGSRRLPLSLVVAPLPGNETPIFGRPPSVLICVTDLAAGVRLPEHKLRDLFGLTPAETRLALALFEGLSPKEAAGQFGVSPNTIHIHLTHIFDKTGTNRQADLMRLMMRAVGVSV